MNQQTPIAQFYQLQTGDGQEPTGVERSDQIARSVVCGAAGPSTGLRIARARRDAVRPLASLQGNAASPEHAQHAGRLRVVGHTRGTYGPPGRGAWAATDSISPDHRQHGR